MCLFRMLESGVHFAEPATVCFSGHVIPTDTFSEERVVALRILTAIRAVVCARRAILVTCVLAGVIAVAETHELGAQGLVSVGAGVGGGIGDRNKDQSGSGAHGAAYVQLHVPVIPVALRADALFTKTANNQTGLALMGDAVYLAPVPVISPYLLAGYGRYGVGKDSSVSGWNAGVGVRVRTPVVAFFVEGKRHQRVSRDLLTIGISR